MTPRPVGPATAPTAIGAGSSDPSARVRTVDGLAFRTLSSRSTAPGSLAFVLIHGIGTSHRYMRRLHDALSASGDVHSIDLPGFGGLPKPAGSPDVSRIAAALGAVLDGLGARGAVLVGHSMGAQWVVELALQRPDLADAVVICGPVTDSEHRNVLTQTLLLGADFVREPPGLGLTVLQDYLRCGPVWYSKQVRHMLRYPLEDRVAQLAVPLLVIRGSRDVIAGEDWCVRLRDLAPSGRMSVIPGQRHVVQHTAAAAVAAGIHTFLRQASVASAPHPTD